MARILRLRDRVNLQIGEVKFTLAPLSHFQKQELAECTRIKDGEEIFDLTKAQALYIKYSLKGIDGVENYDGTKYELEFENGALTDDCVSEVLCIEQKKELLTAAWQILNGIQELIDPVTKKPLEGVDLSVEVGK